MTIQSGLPRGHVVSEISNACWVTADHSSAGHVSHVDPIGLWIVLSVGASAIRGKPYGSIYQGPMPESTCNVCRVGEDDDCCEWTYSTFEPYEKLDFVHTYCIVTVRYLLPCNLCSRSFLIRFMARMVGNSFRAASPRIPQ